MNYKQRGNEIRIKGSRICHSKICHFFILTILKWRPWESRKALPSPRAGHHFVNVSPALPVPGWTEIRDTTLNSYQSRDGTRRIYITIFTNSFLFTISSCMYLSSHNLSPLESQSPFLCLVISLQNYYSLLRCHITSFFFLFFLLLLKKILATPGGMWDLSSPTRDQTHAPCIGSQISTTGPLGKFPKLSF